MTPCLPALLFLEQIEHWVMTCWNPTYLQALEKLQLRLIDCLVLCKLGLHYLNVQWHELIMFSLM